MLKRNHYLHNMNMKMQSYIYVSQIYKDLFDELLAFCRQYQNKTVISFYIVVLYRNKTVISFYIDWVWKTSNTVITQPRIHMISTWYQNRNTRIRCIQLYFPTLSSWYNTIFLLYTFTNVINRACFKSEKMLKNFNKISPKVFTTKTLFTAAPAFAVSENNSPHFCLIFP